MFAAPVMMMFHSRRLVVVLFTCYDDVPCSLVVRLQHVEHGVGVGSVTAAGTPPVNDQLVSVARPR